MGEVKEFKDLPRQQRKHAYIKIKLDGRWQELPVQKYLEITANSLPLGIMRDGTRVDHLANMKKIYMQDDVDGVKHYCRVIFKQMKLTEKKARKEANKKKPLWRRILNV